MWHDITTTTHKTTHKADLWGSLVSSIEQLRIAHQLQYWFHKMGQICYQWLASPSLARAQARRDRRRIGCAQRMKWARAPHTVRARKIYPPKFFLGLHPVYCVAANMDAVNHVSSRRAGQARSGQDRARSAWPHSASSEQLWVDLNVQ